ncbi:unnamed protein product [Meloidogyne enterolobii]|uniref:Uncharacterized protein n=1 Tax=Meloidogyne enterolobii TaxID=390850 RepID=A0ACB0ZLY0_MELEN
MSSKNSEIPNLYYIHKQLVLPNSEYSDKLNEAISRELIARFGTMSQALINRHVKNIYNNENVLQNSLSPTEFRNISIEENEGEESNEMNNDDSFDDSDSVKIIFGYTKESWPIGEEEAREKLLLIFN